MNDIAKTSPAKNLHNAGAFQRYPRNCWYVAAGVPEVSRKPFGRKLLGEEVVLFRKENGQPIAMSDHCPHRGFPLSASKVVGDSIRCGYHGMVYGEDGRCTHVAASKAVPSVLRVRTFPLVEKRNYIWIWMGDPTKADPALVPPTPYEDDDSFYHQFYYPASYAGNIQLAQDNLLDHTHLSYLHAGIMDNEDEVEIVSAKVDSTVEGNIITRSFMVENLMPNASIVETYHIPAGRPITRRTISIHHLPCAVNIVSQFIDESGKVISERCAAVALVPVDSSHSYHFLAMSSSYEQAERDKELQYKILQQDFFALERIQKYFDEYPDTAKEHNVRNDNLGIISRRLIDAMVDAEKEDQNVSGNSAVSLS